jgi:UDP-N-acetyl-D-glucosamine dehydrogenase
MANEILGGLDNKRILVVGISYKTNVSDLRESPVIILINELRARRAAVSWHDDLVKVWNQEKSTELSANFDLAILATPHDYLSLHKLGNIPVIDTRA